MNKFIDENVFSVGRMKSGRLYVELNSKVGWEGFPGYAEEFVRLFSGEVVCRSDSADARVWEVVINNQVLRLVYEDFPVMISLESKTDGGDEFIEGLRVFIEDNK